MRRKAPLCLVLLGLAALGSPATAGDLTLDSLATASKVSMLNVDGKKLSIADVAGEKGTLVIFSCNACPWVKRWEQRMASIGNDALRLGIGVVMINSNDPARVPADDYSGMQTRARERGFRFPYVVDATSEVARAFGASRTPEAFLFDAEGRLVYHGTIDDNARDADAVDRHFLRDAVQAVAEGKEVPISETKAMGCGIKWRQGV